ncbi:CoA ester lyase [bacterium]|nr:CoA ester lyase [bacterium]
MAASLRRSLLFVPGSEPRHLARARAAGADTVVFDLEDAVAPAAKGEARGLVAAALRAGGYGASEPAVRVNAPGTPWFGADLAATVAAGAAAIMVPKAERAGELAAVAERLDGLERAHGRPPGSVRLLALVETAAGIADAFALGAATPRLEALCFGHADLARDLRLAGADAARGVLHHARCALALAARGRGLAAIDCVCLAVRDAEAARADARLGLELGFAGKLCIHPQQVAIVNQVYTPTPAQIARARRVVSAWRTARRDGHAVLTLDGMMVDAPLVAAEEQVLERARQAGALATGDEEETA